MIKNEKKINLGLQLLRMISSIWVVIIHCYFEISKRQPNYYLQKKQFHVPNFMFLSFYFYYRLISQRNISKIIQRFKRLLIPYLIYPFVFLVINNICLEIFGWGNFGKKLSLKDYLIQILLGEKYYGSFWYLASLLFISLIFCIFAFLIRNYFLFIIQLFGFIIYKIHRSSIYDYLKKRNLLKCPFVLTIRFTPIAVIGLTFGSLNLIDNIKNNYARNIVINIIFLYFLLNYNIFNFNNIFIYPDVDSLTIGAINFFSIFSLLPLEKIKNKKIIITLRYITNHTGGIYYLHIFIFFYLKKIYISVRISPILGIIIIYMTAYFICFFGSKLLKKSMLKYLFN